MADPKKPRNTPPALTSKALVRIIRAAERRPRTEAETQVKTERAVVPVEVLAGRVRHAPRGRFVTGGRVEFAGQTKAAEPRDKAVPATGDVAVKRAESSPVQDGSVGAARVAASNRPVKVKSEVEASADARIARRTVKRTAAKSPAVARKPAVRKSTPRKTAADAATSKKATPKKAAVKSTAVKRASADKKVGKSSGCPRAEKVAAKSGGKRAQSGVKSPAQGLKPKRK